LVSKIMAGVVNDTGRPRLERSCGTDARDWIRLGPSRPGFERIEAWFAGHAYDPHRHDTYAIGMTLAGVQCFDYRGAGAASLAGHVIVLHPDEVHDGRAGSAGGFGYRMAYVEPAIVREALGDARAPLPFLADPVSTDADLARAVARTLDAIDSPVEDLEFDGLMHDLAQALAAADRSANRLALTSVSLRAARTARDFLDAHFDRTVGSETLEAVTGIGRYALARHFRACFGTSPYRYLTMRRLDRARALIRAGTPLAEAAAGAGFADQSHLTRQFRKAYGLSPGRWAAMVAARPT
jgi:AraC-like DNA-binding protein